MKKMRCSEMKMFLKIVVFAVLSAGVSSSRPALPSVEAETKEKTMFDVKLEKFDAGKNLKVIKRGEKLT
uniref:Uncharacterized protein n=1 Tax=Chenopodium quinoa TaxID=63459 RepID=A0A803MQM4_CHEQI